MLRTRILAATTVALLMLGAGVSGVSAASASELDPPSSTDESVSLELTTDDPATQADVGGTEDLAVESIAVFRSAVVVSTPLVQQIREVGFYLYKKLDSSKSASWPNSGPQRLITSQVGTDWYPQGAFPSDLPKDVCGPGWAVQQDRVSHNGAFTWPETITYPTSALRGVLVDARHDNLEIYTDVPACQPPPPLTPTCTVVVWVMPSWINDRTPSWPQAYFASYPIDCGVPVDAPVPDLCGTQYQLDKYYDGPTTTALIAGGFLNGPNNPQEALVPGGWGSSYKLVKNPDCVAAAAVTVAEPDCFYGTEFVIDDLLSENVTWGEPVIDDEAGTISITATVVGTALFEAGLSGVSGDRTSRTFTEVYEGPTDDCVDPAIGVVADSNAIRCDTNGWFSFGPAEGVSEDDAALLVYTVAPADYAGDNAPGVQHSVSEAVTITVTVSLVESAQGDYALSDESGTGVADPGTGEITYTFEFTAADDCELGAVVVPQVTAVDRCPNIDIIGLGSTLAGGIATFTVTRDDNISFSYTVNGGAPIAVVFPVAEDEVTIAVTPGDTVEVTAVAAAGFALPDNYEPWSYTFFNSTFCPGTLPSTVAAAEMVLPDCLGNQGRLVLTNEGGVIWTLNGEVVEGNSLHDITPGTMVELTAELEEASEEFPGGWTWNDPEQQTEWNDMFAVADDECLPTLAFTGANALTSWLGVLAVLLTVAGMGFVLLRRRVEV